MKLIDRRALTSVNEEQEDDMRNKLLAGTALAMALSLPLAVATPQAAYAQSEQQDAQAPNRIQPLIERIEQGGEEAFTEVGQELQDLKTELNEGQPPEEAQQTYQEAQTKLDEAITAVENQDQEQTVSLLEELDQIMVVMVEYDQQQASAEGGADATQLEVVQPAPDVQVEQEQPTVDLTQSQPEVDVTVPDPEVTVTQPEPEIDVVVTMPEPEVQVDQAQPDVQVSQSQPEVDVQVPEPEVTVDQPEPEVNVVQQGQPDVSVEQAEPQVQVTQADPEVTVEQPEPTVNVQAATGENVDVNVEAAEGEDQQQAQSEQQTEDQQQIAVLEQEDPANAEQATAPADMEQEVAAVDEVQDSEQQMAATTATDERATPAADGSFRSYNLTDETERNQFTIAGEFPADALIGRTVYGSQGDNIGEVSDILIGDNNRADQVIIDVGGFLGLGERSVAVDIERLSEGPDGNIMADMTEDEAENLPRYDERDSSWLPFEE